MSRQVFVAALSAALLMCTACSGGGRKAEGPIGYTDWAVVAKNGDLPATPSVRSESTTPSRGSDGMELPAPLREDAQDVPSEEEAEEDEGEGDEADAYEGLAEEDGGA